MGMKSSLRLAAVALLSLVGVLGVCESADAQTVNAATGTPAISGTARVGHTLTAAKGTIADGDGTTKADAGDTGYGYAYQWIRVDSDGTSNAVDISGATSSTYSPMGADVGKKVQVQVTFTDDADNPEMVTSAAYPSSGTIRAAGFCGRTPQVRDAIVDKIPGVTDCADVTATHLGAITGTLDLSSDGISALAADDFDELTALTELSLSYNALTTLPVGVFDELTALTELSLSYNALTTVPAGVFDELTALTELWLSDNALTTLPVGVFDKLPALTKLWLHGNALTTLPAGVFDKLPALTELWLSDNALTTLPVGVFDKLPALTTLTLHGNALTTLPAGVFDALTALTWVSLQSNPGAPFSPEAVALPDDGTVPSTGGTVTLDGSGSDGKAWGANVTYGWALTDPASGVTVTFDDAASATPEVTIPALAVGTELTFTLTVTGRGGPNLAFGGTVTGTNTATVTVTASTDATLSDLELEDGDGHAVSLTPAFASTTTSYTAHVASGVDVITVTPTNNSSATFAYLDGSDMTLTDADMSEDGFQASLSTGANTIKVKVTAQDGATTQTYTVAVQRPTTATATAATGTPAISGTARVGHTLTAAKGTITDGNGTTKADAGDTGYGYAYQWIRVDADGTSNAVDISGATSNTFMPMRADVGKKVKVQVTFTDDADNPETVTSAAYPPSGTIRAAGFCGRTPEVVDAIVDKIPGVTDCADVTATHLGAITGTLDLSSDGISALAADDFDGLTALTDLRLSYNALTTLPVGVFDKLPALTTLRLSYNALTTLPVGVFDKLPALTTLTLHGNALTTLPVGVFDKLPALTTLWLHDNALTTLPAGVFDKLPALTTLTLNINPGAPFSPEAVALPDDGTVPSTGGTVTLDGRGSGGAWGTNVTYGWALTDPASGVTVTFDDAASATPEVTIPALAVDTELTFTLTVTGRGGLSLAFLGTVTGTNTATVTVTASTDATLSDLELEDGNGHAVSLTPAFVSTTTSYTAHVANGVDEITLTPTSDSYGTFAYLDGSDMALTDADAMEDGFQVSLSTGANTIKVKVTAQDGVTTQTYTVAVRRATTATVATGAPAISGTARVGHTLTAAKGTIADGDGTTKADAGDTGYGYAYQWIRVDADGTSNAVDISGATSNTYSPMGVDVGKKVQVQVTFTDDADNPETVTSAAYPSSGTIRAAGFCGRTPAVVDAIVDAIASVTDCADVTETHLGAITGTLDLESESITALAAGDFDGLTALTTLNLIGNSLTMLPAGVFDDLTALTTLFLGSNDLTSLPAGVFEPLTSLAKLGLDDNSLTTLPAGVFDGLTALTSLELGENDLTMLPAGVFDDLTALSYLGLSYNDLTTLPDDVFEPLTASELELVLNDNPGAPFSPEAVALPDDGTVPSAGGKVTLDGRGSGGAWGTNVTYAWALTESGERGDGDV